jgi:hypothetical protein
MAIILSLKIPTNSMNGINHSLLPSAPTAGNATRTPCPPSAHKEACLQVSRHAFNSYLNYYFNFILWCILTDMSSVCLSSRASGSCKHLQTIYFRNIRQTLSSTLLVVVCITRDTQFYLLRRLTSVQCFDNINCMCSQQQPPHPHRLAVSTLPA